jgi:peptidoglycan/LPS O-acetylase OafA/YrhL
MAYATKETTESSEAPGAAAPAVTASGSPRSYGKRPAATTGRRPAARPRPRLYLLDGLRLVAALMVAVHHYVGTFRVNKPNTSPWGRPVEEIFPNVFPVAAYGWIGVEFFFVISGFVICMSCWGKRPRDYAISRAVRLYPAYWFAILLTTAVLTAWPMVREPLSHSETLLNFSMLQQGLGVPGVDGVYWTLWSELRFYLIFLLVMVTGLTYRKVVIFCGAWGFLATIAFSADSELLTLVANPAGAWFFIAGLTLYLMHRFGPDLLLWGMLGMSWVMGQYQLIDRVAYESVSSWKGALILYTGFLTLMAAIALGRPRLLGRVRGRWLTVAGSMTYPFYLIHYAIGLTAIYLLHDDVDARLLVLGLIVGALAASWLIHRLVERPVARIMKRQLNLAFDGAWERRRR